MSEKSDDRELLELAAKAAGIEGYADQDHVGGFFCTPDHLSPVIYRWLQDDGDAFRLAVKLKIAPDFSYASKEVPAYIVANFPKKYSRLANGGKCWVTAEYVPEEMWCGRQDDQRFADWYMNNYPGVVRGIDSATRRAIVRAAAQIGKAMP